MLRHDNVTSRRNNVTSRCDNVTSSIDIFQKVYHPEIMGLNK